MATQLQPRPAQQQPDAAAGLEPALTMAATAPGDDLVLEAPRPADGPGAERINDVIEPGRALALADFDPPGVGAGARLMRMAYRIGIPASALRSPFRKRAPLRLLAAPVDPLAGQQQAGMALRAGHFLVAGIKVPLGEIDYRDERLSAPVARYVHGFRWLADLVAACPRDQALPVAQRILAGWLDAHPKPTRHAAWGLDATAARLVSWMLHAPVLISGDDSAFRTRLLDAMERSARHLDRKAPSSGDDIAALGAWCGVIAAGLLLPEGKARRLFGEAGLAQVLGRLIGDDGGVLSRAPLAQIEGIRWLIQLRACYRAVNEPPVAALETALGLMVPPLLGITHADGGLASWQGAGGIAAGDAEALIEASEVRTRPLREPRQWGYQRVAAGNSVLLVDAAPPPLARHAIEGCASTLGIEFSTGAQRIITSCGGAALSGPQIPPRLAQGLRATAAHSCLCIDDTNSTAVLINGRLGTGVDEVELERRAMGQATRIEGSHDGYAARFGLVHRRILLMRDDGSELRGEDLLVPVGKRGKRGKVGFAIRFHLGTGIDVQLADSGQGAMLALPDGTLWQFRSTGEPLVIEESLWVDGRGRPHPAQQLVIQGMVSRGGGSFGWLLKKMG